jgi:hypothetical protein
MPSGIPPTAAKYVGAKKGEENYRGDGKFIVQVDYGAPYWETGTLAFIAWNQMRSGVVQCQNRNRTSNCIWMSICFCSDEFVNSGRR